MKRDANYFIKKFTPLNNWCEDVYTYDGNHCALGHLGMDADKVLAEVPKARDLVTLFISYFGKPFATFYKGREPLELTSSAAVAIINDSADTYYETSYDEFIEGDTPKERILNALYKIKDLEEGNKAVGFVKNLLKESILEETI